MLSVKAPVTEQKQLPVIAVSTFALYDMVSAIGGKDFEVSMAVPFGVDIHSFEPTPRDLATLSKSALFIYSGAGLEPWASTFSSSVKSLDISKSVDLISLDHDHHDESAAEHHHEGYDPHYWLDMHNMLLATEVISDALTQIAPGHAKSIQKNATRYGKRLQTIDKRFEEALSSCKKKVIIVDHDAFGYLAKRYGFEVIALTGLSPEAMPSAKTMAAVVDIIREKQIHTIFFETFVSDRLISTIAKETGAKVEVLQPLANITADEMASGADFETLLLEDLDKLVRAMECQ